ncbi:MAG: transglycosylase SLT domain-containing protein [Calditrichia bacterium]
MLSSFLLVLLVGVTRQYGQGEHIFIYHAANKAYEEGRFAEALESYRKIQKIAPEFYRKDPLLNFKIGRALFKLEQFHEAVDYFEKSRKELKGLSEFPLFFQAKSYWMLQDTLRAQECLENIYRNYPGSVVQSWADSLRLEFWRSTSRHDSTLKYLSRVLRSNFFEKTQYYLLRIKIMQEIGDTTSFRKYAFDFLDRHPHHAEAEWVYKQLSQSYNRSVPTLKEFRQIIKYLTRTGQYLQAERVISNLSKKVKEPEYREFLNWTPVELAYLQGEYRRVLNWCLNQKKHFKSYKIRREIDLYIPRCYLRLGETQKSIKAYLDFHRLHPTDRLAAEVLWKVGWLYEQQNYITRATELYRKLVKKHHRSQFANEANFRIGLNYYRLKKYEKARRHWMQVSRKTSDEGFRQRLQYWIAKSYQAEKKFEKYYQTLAEIAENPVDSYYAAKAFFLTSDGYGAHAKIRELFWKLHHQETTHLSDFLNEFQQAFILREILGKRWAQNFITHIAGKGNEQEYLFALAELLEKMGDYGKAYRYYRKIFNSYYLDADLPELAPILKKLYPYYYMDQIEEVSQKYNIPETLILSVIKKESAFEKRIVSYANAYGLMQLIPSTASQVAAKLHVRFTNPARLFDPELNIQMGSYYLKDMLKRYRGSIILALAAYNAGPHRVDRWIKTYPTSDPDLLVENLEYEQTRVYVRTILKYYWIYQLIEQPDATPEDLVVWKLAS